MSVTDARGQGKDYGRLSDLHPDGFGHVPRALIAYADAQAVHCGVFVAISSAARPISDAANGHRWIARELPRSRLQELTGIKKRETLRSKIRDLERWGFIREVRRPNAASDFEILPTHQHDLSSFDAAEPVPDSNALQVAPQPHQTRTNPAWGSENGALQVAPQPHQARTNPAWGSENGALRTDEWPSDEDHQSSGVSEHQGAAPPDNGALPSYIEERDKNCRCTEPHPPFLTHPQYMTLRKAARRQYVDAAIEEVAFRLGNPSMAPEIRQPYTMVRNIAECYSGRCRTSHGDLHGEKALMYHRSRRADIEQVLRSKGGIEPDPGSLGPLQSLVGDLLADSSLFLDDPDDHEQRRAKFIAQLQRMEQEEAHR